MTAGYDPFSDNEESSEIERDYDEELQTLEDIPTANAANDASTVKAPVTQLGKGVGVAADVAATALDAGTLGATRNVGGVLNMLTAIGGEGGSLVDAYHKGYGRIDEKFADVRERLPLGMEVAAEIGGGVAGVGRIADKAIALTRKFAPGAMSRIGNYAATYAASIPMAAADRYMRNDESFEDALKGGTIDAMLGVGIQAGIGDVGLPFGQKLWAKLFGKPALGQAVDDVTQGAIGEGMTLENLHAAAQNIDPNTGILNLEVDGQPQWETARKFYNSIADTKFPDPNARSMGTGRPAERRALYQETVDTVRRYADEANEEAAQTMEAVWGTGRRSDPRAKTARQKYAAAQLDQISRELPANPGDPAPLGALELDARATVNDVQAHLEKTFGQRLPTLMKTQGDVWNTFVRSMRGEEIGFSGGKRLIKSEGAEGVRAEEILPDNMTLAGLYNTRKEMADLLTPAGRVGGNPLTKTKRKTVVEIMSVLDNQIDELSSGSASQARGDFAHEMRVQDAEEMGVKFYNQRAANVDDQYMFTDHYRETLEDFMSGMDADTKHAFRKGFTSAMSDMTGKRSVLTELGNYLGDHPTGRSGGNVLAENKQGRDHLELVLGKEDADAIVDMYTNGNQNIEFRNKLADLFDEKRGDPGFKAEKLGANMRPQDVPPGEGGAMIEGLAYLRNQVLSRDKSKVDAIARLLTYEGKALQRLLNQGIEQASPGGGAQIGVRGALASSTEDLLKKDKEQKQEKASTPYDPFSSGQ